jgi:hypothetical protein
MSGLCTEDFVLLKEKLWTFMTEHIYPNELIFLKYVSALFLRSPRQQKEVGDSGHWDHPPILMELQAKAKALGLWNLFLPVDSASLAGFAEYGGGLTNRQYAELCEIMGTSNHMEFAAQVVVCQTRLSP